MNSISLTHVTAFVVAVSMASFFVNADDALAHSTDDNSAVQAAPSAKALVIAEVKESANKFTFTSLDNDKDGKLSQQEVMAGNNAWLVKSFQQIDSNADKAITEQELVDFVAKTTASK
ncbi:hypothetical protein CMT41_14700 [Colwellia sp. MT41]|uniref:hypothetical protein n=1 Tax=Colwellia sp. MT41 TaxID=58049 RepID=UPI000717616D|nr:hypothetical protein [Colwellia sp. MT41]ALO35830.1 hypothetical protein CMT41_14700 [Colwellia sp. MT41]